MTPNTGNDSAIVAGWGSVANGVHSICLQPFFCDVLCREQTVCPHTENVKRLLKKIGNPLMYLAKV